MRRILGIAIAGLWLLGPSTADAAKPPRDIFGIRIGMSEEEAEERLRHLGATKSEREEEGEKEEGEIWTLKHPRFAYFYLGIDDDKRVKVVQAYAREKAPRLRFSDLGNLKQAKKLGVYIYQWDLPARGRDPRLLVTARSNDSVYVASYSILGRSPRLAAGGREREREGAEERESLEDRKNKP